MLATITALVQDAPATSWGALLTAVLAAPIGWVATKAYDGLKQGLFKYDQLPSVVHAALAPLFAFGLGWLASTLGLEAIGDPHNITAEWLGAALTALVALGIKRAEAK